EEACPTRDVRARELGAVARAVVIGTPEVAYVVEEPGGDADGGARGTQTLRRILLTLVADQKARERERYVEAVLAIVVDGVDAMKAVDLAGEQPLEVREGALQRLERHLRPGGAEQRGDRRQDRLGRAHLHAVGYVEIAAPCAHLVVGKLGLGALAPPLKSARCDLKGSLGSRATPLPRRGAHFRGPQASAGYVFTGPLELP